MSTNIRTTAGRAKLKPRHDPYWHKLGKGKAIGYRKPATGTSSWKARIHHTNEYSHSSFDGSLDFDAALVLAQAFFAKIERGVDTTLVTVADAARAYERIKPRAVPWHRRLIDSDPIAGIKLDKLNRESIRQWLERHASDNVGATNRKKTGLASPLNFALRERAVADNHAWAEVLKREPENNARTLVLTLAQRKALVAELARSEPRLAPLVRLLCLIPLRPGAAAALTVADFDGSTLRIRTDKANAGRAIACPPVTAALLAAQCKDKLPNAPVFPNNRGGHWASWQRQIGRAVKAAGLPHEASLYTLRHSIISELVMQGADLLTIATIAGTSVRLIEKTYGHLTADHVRSALGSMSI